MSEPFLGEVRIFPYTFAPLGWAFCNGTILQIAQNTALYALLGNMYGGNGTTTFALPNLQGRAPMHFGTGPGLTSRTIGQTGGAETVALTAGQLPAHAHALTASNDTATVNNPTNAVVGRPFGRGGCLYALGSEPPVSMDQTAVGSTGDSGNHNNMQPYLALNFCIAVSGIFPPRT